MGSKVKNLNTKNKEVVLDASPLAEEFIAVDGCWGRNNHFTLG